ncbi:hypothetical protein ABZW18_06060 [Streptomyces sp. NPDC004647]|uniref:hypothetical protein n=1 Tax=Streptomyces sp. NPDC004647 TaxID=3154671 RepID=UPI0033A85D42
MRSAAARVLKFHDEVLRSLRHPRGGRVRGGTQDPDPSAGVLDDGKHVHPNPDRATVSKKSQAGKAPAWERGKFVGCPLSRPSHPAG